MSLVKIVYRNCQKKLIWTCFTEKLPAAPAEVTVEVVLASCMLTERWKRGPMGLAFGLAPPWPDGCSSVLAPWPDMATDRREKRIYIYGKHTINDLTAS